jgi:hypothetical protein
MAITIDQAHINTYRDNLHVLLQQGMSKLKGVVPIEYTNGEKHFFDRLGKFAAGEIVGNFQDTNVEDAPHSRRMASVKRYHSTTYLDDINKFNMLLDPTSDYVRGVAAALGRKFDDVVIDALLGTAATGADGSGSAAFDTSNQQIAAGGTGLTVSKFNSALRILENNEVDVDRERLYLIVGAYGVEDLLGETNFTSFDYQNKKALGGEGLPMFRGVEIIRSQRVPDSGGSKQAILMSENAVKVAMAEDLRIETDIRPDKFHALQISSYMQMAAVRMDDESVVSILHT